MNSWSIAQANLTSVGVLTFIFGFLAARLKSDVRVPDAIYQFLSIYLLFGIGLKGGHSLKSSSFSELATPALTTIACGVLIPVLAFYTLKLIKVLNDADRGSIAAHWASESQNRWAIHASNLPIEGYESDLQPTINTLIGFGA